jgi:hypothetical protein
MTVYTSVEKRGRVLVQNKRKSSPTKTIHLFF